MSANNTVLGNLPIEEDIEDNVEDDEPNNTSDNWSVRIMGRNIPYWVIVLVIVVIVVVVGFIIKNRRKLIKVKLSGTGISSVGGSTTSASINSEQVRQELRQLFEQF